MNKLTYTSIFILCIILILFILNSNIISREKTHLSKEKENIEQQAEIDNIESVFKNMEIENLDSIIDRKNRTQKFIIYLFDTYDCETCIKEGFFIIKSIMRNNKVQVFPVLTIGNPSFFQKLYNFNEYIYLDNKDLIRKDLKYIPTPSILYIDGNNCIIEAFFPQKGKEYKDFTKRIKP